MGACHVEILELRVRLNDIADETPNHVRERVGAAQDFEYADGTVLLDCLQDKFVALPVDAVLLELEVFQSPRVLELLVQGGPNLVALGLLEFVEDELVAGVSHH